MGGLGQDVLNVFKMTLMEEQRLLTTESQRWQGTTASTTGTLSSSPSVLRVPALQQLVNTIPAREQSEDLVDMLKKAYDKPEASKAKGLTTQPSTVREGQVLSMV